jgi:clan AA aspartic protease (TIGR02281 family)
MFLGTSAYAQNVDELTNIFGGLVQKGKGQPAQSQWQRLPGNEVACINQQLENRGMSIDAMIERGVAPGDLHIAQARSYSRNYRGDQTSQESQTSGRSPSPYVVDGLALGDKVPLNSAAYNKYHCSSSEKFLGFTWCHKDETKRYSRTEITFSNSILHTQDGIAWYINRYIEPATFERNEVRSEINRLSAKYGQSPAREIRLPHKDGLPDAIMVVWGKVELQKLSDDEARTVAHGGRHEGILVGFLGDLEKSAKAGTPVYELSGGAGYVWVATYNSAGRGVLRFLAIDDANIRNRGGGGTTVIQLKNESGIFVVPVEINGAITLDFVVDSGASDVSLPADVVSTLIRTRTISPSDFVGQQTYVLADGSEVPSDVFVIKSLKVGDNVVHNVRASIASPKATLLLGQSFLGHFKSWSIDNAKHALILE